MAYNLSNKMRIWILTLSIILVAALVALLVLLLVQPSTQTKLVSVYLDPDSTSASFAKGNQADVKVMAKNLSSSTQKVGAYILKYQAEASLVDAKVATSFLPLADWVYPSDTGFKDNIITISGSASGFVELAPNEVKQIALIQLVPKASFTISIKKDLSNLTGENGKSIFDEKDTPDSQPFNLKE